MTRDVAAVVFDMDGVLIDSEPIWREVEREVFARVGLRLSDEQLAETQGVRIDQVVELWHSRHPWEEPPREDIVEAVVDGMERAIGERGVWVPGAEDAVRRFADAGLRLALASSSSPRLIRAVLELSDAARCFEVVHSAEEEERGKPDPAVYLTTARLLGVAPRACLAVEDSASGVRAAKAAGMLCVVIPEVAGSRLEGADLVLGSIEELDERIWPLLEARPVAS